MKKYYAKIILLILNLFYLILGYLSIFGIEVFIPFLILSIITGIVFIFINNSAFKIKQDGFRMWFNIFFRATFFFSVLAILFNVQSYPGNNILSLLALLLLWVTIFYAVDHRREGAENKPAYNLILVYAVVYHLSIGFTTPVW